MQESSAIRLFFAAPLNEDARNALGGFCDRIKQKDFRFARWTHPLDYHITLKFIGDVDSGLAGRLAGPAREAAASEAPFALSLRGVGAFGRPAAPSVFWCGVDDGEDGDGGLDALRSLHERIDRAATACGVAADDRPYRPHITIARQYRGDVPYDAQARRFAELAPPPAAWRVDELVLYRTNFGRRPAYEALARFPLGPA